MKLFRIQATGPHPARYRGLTGKNEAEAISKAQQRHVAAGFALDGHEFKVTHSYLIICNSVIDQGDDASHTICLTDRQLAEVESALVEHARLLENRIARSLERNSLVSVAPYESRLQAAKAALHYVMAA